MLLMEPGPTQVDPRVIQAMCSPPEHHLSNGFRATTDRVVEALRGVFLTTGEVVLLPSSGRGGIEAVVSSLDLGGRAMLVLSNGSFGSMMASIARRCGHEVVELIHPPDAPVPAEAVAEALGAHDIGLVGIVHCESSTGVLNDLAGLGALCHEAGALLLVDAVSSLGGTPLAMDALEIDFCVSATQKAIGSVTGLALVALSGPGTEAVLAAAGSTRSSYFNLARWWELWLPRERGGLLASGFRRFPFSMPVHPVYALEVALEVIAEEGLAQRLERHAAIAATFRNAMLELGIVLFGATAAHSPTVTALQRAPGVALSDVRRDLRERFGITVAGPMGVPDAALRVGHMAESARTGPMLQTVAGIAELVKYR